MWKKKTEAAKFYDNFVEKLLTDYLKSNPRVESAITFLIDNLSDWNNNILDIGCGIGWSSYELVVNSQARVTGIDLSPKLIATAKELFKVDGLKFINLDILEQGQDLVIDEGYDFIALIDVFEHIPKEKRNEFYNLIQKITVARSKILLTCPSKYHQSYLEKEKPEGLQPVDEVIDLTNLQELANKVGGEIIYFDYQSIWHYQDYFHCIIEIGADFYNLPSTSKKRYKTESLSKRLEKVEKSSFKFLIRKLSLEAIEINNKPTFFQRIIHKLKHYIK